MPGLIFGFITTYFVLKALIPFLLVHAPDKPNDRSSHKFVTASSGGIAFIMPTLIYAFFTRDFQWFICLPLAIVGLVDDRIGLSKKVRFFAQLFTVFLIIQNTIFLNYPMGNIKDYLLMIFLLIFGTAVINFVNFIDGIDGLISGCFVLIIFFAISFHGLPLYVLVGSLIAFMILNWHPAKIFMGDVGSTFLGSVFVLILYSRSDLLDSFRFLCLGSPIFIDALSTIFRRMIYKQNIFKAHKSHLFQRLYQSGWSHSKISLMYLAATIFIFASLFVGTDWMIFSAVFLTFIFGIYLDFKFAIPFNKSI